MVKISDKTQKVIAGYDEVIGQLKLINEALSTIRYRVNGFQAIEINSDLHRKLVSEIIQLNAHKEILWDSLKFITKEE